MAELFVRSEAKQRIYWDRQQFKSFEDQLSALKSAKMLYVGNLSFFTTEAQIHALFSKAGPIKRIIMGLNNITKTPCGFCFVEYYEQEHAHSCLKFISNTMLDGQIIRCELDAGFIPGRQYGRGRGGGQVRDERRLGNDATRRNLVKYEIDAPLSGYKVIRTEESRESFRQQPSSRYEEEDVSVGSKRRRDDDE